MKPSATIAVVAYNDDGTIEACVTSLRSVTSAPILIIDNHSTDSTWALATRLADEIPEVTAIRAPNNGGYASAGNLARSHVETPYLAVTNADCTFTGDWITPIVTYLDGEPSVAAASPTVTLADKSGINAEGLTIHKTGFGFNRHLGANVQSMSDSPSAVSGIQGTAFVVRTESLDTIGEWYTGGFLYHEDVELSWSLRHAGFDISHVPTPPVVHAYDLTMSPEKLYLLERNRIEMVWCHLSAATKLRLSPAIVATEIAVWLYAARKGTGMVAAKWQSYVALTRRGGVRRSRRRQVAAFATVSDGELLEAMSWKWPSNQIRKLQRDEPTTGRRGDRELPVD